MIQSSWPKAPRRSKERRVISLKLRTARGLLRMGPSTAESLKAALEAVARVEETIAGSR